MRVIYLYFCLSVFGCSASPFLSFSYSRLLAMWLLRSAPVVGCGQLLHLLV